MLTVTVDKRVSERVQALKDRYLSTKPTVCTERARIYTEVYQRHEAKPLIVKRAIALAETLEKMSIYIDEGELIVGSQSCRPRA